MALAGLERRAGAQEAALPVWGVQLHGRLQLAARVQTDPEDGAGAEAVQWRGGA